MTAAERQIKHADFAAVNGVSLSAYLKLMRAFVATEISVTDFERRYIDLFGDDELAHPEPTFRVLNDLFFAVDAFCADPVLRDVADLDEDQLRVQVRMALTVLDPSVRSAFQSEP